MKFADIIGQTALKEYLVRSVESGRISHAQLFTGPACGGRLCRCTAGGPFPDIGLL